MTFSIQHINYDALKICQLSLLLLLLWNPLNSFAQISTPSKNAKIKGMSFRGPYDPVYDTSKVQNIKTSNAEWLAFIPESTLNRSTLTLIPDKENDFWSETIEANIQGIQIAKNLGFKILLKPHIILGEIPEKSKPSSNGHGSLASVQNAENTRDKTKGAEWRGDLNLRKENDWETFETSYETYIIRLAHIADSLNVNLFCIGTELKNSTTNRPIFWKNLIHKVRAIYDGPITYSANWDEYQNFPLWKELDYISVNTYFPISWKKTPKIRKTIRNWRSIKRKLKKFSKKENKKILLTEFGYRNVNFAGKRPWTHDRQDNKSPNNQAQTNLYKAFFKTFWDQPWVAGGFCWQWFHKPPSENNTTFSIQDKPALEIIQEYYKK